jgi:hypothetical protein
LDIANGYYPRAYDIDIYRFGNSQIIHCPSPCNGAYYTISPPALTGGKHSRRNFKYFSFQPFRLRAGGAFLSLRFSRGRVADGSCEQHKQKEPAMAKEN